MPRKLNKSRTARVIRDVENGVFATNISVTSLSASGDLSALTGTVHFITSSHVSVEDYIFHHGDADTYIEFNDDEIAFVAGDRTFIKLQESSTDKMIINNGGLDIDLQIKGESDANLIRTDAANDRVGIGISTAQSKLHIAHTDTPTWPDGGASNETYSDFLLTLRNNTDTLDAFAGIAFDISTETDADSIGAAIVAVCKNATDTRHDTDLVFATNPASDDGLTERMRIKDDGQVGIGTDDPDLGSAVGLHILATTGQGQGNLRVECTEATIDQYQTLINCQWPNDTSIDDENYWDKFDNGSGQVGAIHSEVTYGPFTGCHYTTVPSGSIRRGMVLKSTGETFFKRGIGNAWVITEATTTEKDKAVAGVYSGLALPAEESVIGEELAAYNAVGEGSVLVTDAGGNIETGDYICSSNNLGHGMKQDDDLLHNYTVAKANEPIDFSTVEVDPELGFKSFLLACTYHCG